MGRGQGDRDKQARPHAGHRQPVSEFEKVSRPNSGWHAVRLDGLRSPGMNARELEHFPLVRELPTAKGVEPSTENVAMV